METYNRVKRFSSQVAILVVIIVLMTGALVMSFQFEYTQAKLAPLAVSIIVLSLSIAQLMKELRGKANEETNIIEAADGSPADKNLGGFIYEILWIVGFIISIYLFGFYIAVPLFSLIYMKSHQAKWIPSISIALMTLVFIYAVFIRILDFRLHSGLIFILLDG
jgi:hypothetical protein